MKKTKFKPNELIVQWHITERCNQRCAHCYQESYNKKEMNLSEMEIAIDKIIDLIKKFEIKKHRATINITGGEPFIREDFFIFLKKISEKSNYYNWSIMSNGTMLNDNKIVYLKKIGLRSIQLSLEGIEETNDDIRGSGNFQNIVKVIKLLNKYDIHVRVSFTLSKKNYNDIKPLATILSTLNVKYLGIRRIVPLGINKNELKNLILEPHELRKVYQQIEKINLQMIEKDYNLKLTGGCENAVFNDEISDKFLMSFSCCGATDGRILTIMPDGEVLICRRCPIVIGNIKDDTLENIYYSEKYEKLRNKEDVPLECNVCYNYYNCYGGAKCITYSITKKTAPDIQCWKLFDSCAQALKYIKSPTLKQQIKLIIKNLNYRLKKIK